uniref:Uncharacterized protein n=1 Tax=Pseudomonas phage Cygsa01 TaxID=3138529 RepID=A0AAU6W371_9VIRU
MSNFAKARYLEISPRQTGKTHRLIQDATHQRYENDKIIAIVSCMHRRFWEDLAPFAKAIGQSEEEVSNLLSRVGIDPRSDKVAWYYDDFDFLHTMPRHIKHGAYYVTTPKTLRDFSNLSEEAVSQDFLLALVLNMDGVYAAAAPAPLTFKNRAAMLDHLPPESIETEVKGHLWTVTQKPKRL